MMDFRRNSKVSDIKKQLIPEELAERGGGRQQEKYSMNHTPIVTVFTTVYNVAEYLPRFFRCMRKQTFRDYVLLIIDDGSEDDTYKVCGPFAAKDPRIRLVQIPHKGITAARNYLRNGMYREALTALSSVAVQDRDGTWYYYSATANFYLGNKIAASQDIERAIEIEPDNSEYRRLQQMLQSGGDFYDNYRVNYSNSLRTDRLCLTLCAANLCLGPYCRVFPICC